MKQAEKEKEGGGDKEEKEKSKTEDKVSGFYLREGETRRPLSNDLCRHYLPRYLLYTCLCSFIPSSYLPR